VYGGGGSVACDEVLDRGSSGGGGCNAGVDWIHDAMVDIILPMYC
jgi:hypothetical protein